MASRSAWRFGHALLLLLQGQIAIGQVIAYMGLMDMLRFPTFISLFTFSLVQLGLASAERILALIMAETELDENTRRLQRADRAARSCLRT